MSSRWIVFVAIVFCFTASSATPGEGVAPKEETLLTIYVQPDDPEKPISLTLMSASSVPCPKRLARTSRLPRAGMIR
jgi:hypothetical protein